MTQVVLTGVATSLGIESTARAAHELGYHVVIVRDAVVDIDPGAHATSLRVTLPALAEIDDTSTPTRPRSGSGTRTSSTG